MNAASPNQTPALADLLRILVENRGPDLHLQCDEAPIGRIDGELGRFDMPPLTEADVLALAREVLGGEDKLSAFLQAEDCDTALSIPGLGRFRANLFFQRNRPGLVLRTIGTKILSLDALALPGVLKDIAAANEGLVLVTGATGSGKSTTLAAMIDHINRTQACHIMGLEDPIEFVHENKLALINQREIAVDSQSFAAALKHVLRQDPDVILIGEMRDLESATVALTAAETGHLVFATLHTQDAVEAIERLINMFPSDRVQQIRLQLSLGLRAILSQKLLPRISGGRPAGARNPAQQPPHPQTDPRRRHDQDPRRHPVVALRRHADLQPSAGGAGAGGQSRRSRCPAVFPQAGGVEDEPQGHLLGHFGVVSESRSALKKARRLGAGDVAAAGDEGTLPP